jgi:hypothetical protein
MRPELDIRYIGPSGLTTRADHNDIRRSPIERVAWEVKFSGERRKPTACPLRARRHGLRRSLAGTHGQRKAVSELPILWSGEHDKPVPKLIVRPVQAN